MNAYFFKMTNEERNNILDQHKHIYDGFVTNYGQNTQQPLYVQDYANDKGGITVNNKGEVTEYKNMKINEMRFDGKSTGLFDEDAQSGSGFVPTQNIDEDGYYSVGEQLDMIGDGDDDLEHGTFGDEEEIEIEDEFETEEEEEDEFILTFEESVDEDLLPSLTESVNKSLDMFRRFKKY